MPARHFGQVGSNDLMHGNTTPIRIAGYGACMINGYPHPAECSFFARFQRLLEGSAQIPVESDVVSLQGFPAERASRMVHRVLRLNPHVVVLQFGSTDLQIRMIPKWMRSIQVRSGAGTKAGLGSMEPFRTSPAIRLMERVQLQLCRIFRISPDHGNTRTYLESMDRICAPLRRAGIQPILLSPFPHGRLASDFWARRFSDALGSYALSEGILFIDVHKEMDRVPKEVLLLSDRLHLSKYGHRMLGDLLFERALPLMRTFGSGSLGAIGRSAEHSAAETR